MRKTVVVAGVGRSGTSWLGSVIASCRQSRIMFEPFHSRRVRDYSQFEYFQYMRPDEANEPLKLFASRVLRGRIRHPWVDREVGCLYPEYRIVKEIRANLFLRWLHTQYPDLPIIFIVRHPCAVVLSRLIGGWSTDTDIESMLSQKKLVDDFLSDNMSIIRNAKTDVEKHAIIWSIQNLVPLRQFEVDGLNVMFYENLCIQPEVERDKIAQILAFADEELNLELFNAPSTTALRGSSVFTGSNKVTRWKDELSARQISTIQNVVRQFGLGHIYGDSFTPIIAENEIMKR